MLVTTDRIYLDFDNSNTSPLESVKEAYFESRKEIHRLFPNSDCNAVKLIVGGTSAWLKDITVKRLSDFQALDEIKKLFFNIEIDNGMFGGIRFVWEVKTDVILDSMYFHIGNGGLGVEILDTPWGPKIRFRQSFFGSASTNMETYVANGVIGQLADFFDNFRNYNFKKDSCTAAELDSKKNNSVSTNQQEKALSIDDDLTDQP